jgi:hypothetical protein
MSTAKPLQQPSRRVKLLANVIDVAFDDTQFAYTEYSASIDDTLRFDNKSGVSVTVYILTSDGTTPTTDLLGTYSQVTVAGGHADDYVVASNGTFVLSLEPAQLRAANTNVLDAGHTTTVIVGS